MEPIIVSQPSEDPPLTRELVTDAVLETIAAVLSADTTPYTRKQTVRLVSALARAAELALGR